MLLFISAVIAGFALLAWSADRFVLGSSAIAHNLGIPPLIVGLTIVAFGTSFPEMLISGLAAWEGNTGLAIGNALGSNITNIGLVLGITAVMVPLAVHSDTLRREFPILFIIMLLAGILMMDLNLGKLDGLILCAGIVVLMFVIVRLAIKTRKSDPLKSEFAAEIPQHMPMAKAFTLFVIGLVLLFISSRMLVWGSVNIAHTYGVSDLIIGLTIVAIGTSLPELGASVMSALKNEHDIAIGNVIGSNMFNLLAVLGLPGLIHPSSFESSVMSRDFLAMAGMTVLLFMMAYGIGKKKNHISRIGGIVLLACYCAYIYMLYRSSI